MLMPNDQSAMPASDMSQGYVICLSVLPDGTFSVTTETLEEESQEETGEPGSEMSQPINTFGEALKKVLAIYQNDGQDGDADASFDAGYAGDDSDTQTVDITKKPDMRMPKVQRP